MSRLGISQGAAALVPGAGVAELPRTRPSKMPLVFACPSSLLPAVAPVDAKGDAANLGDAVHAALGLHVQGLEPNTGLIAARHSVDTDELERLYRYGIKAWAELRAHFPSPATEVRLDPTDITAGGHVDVLQQSDGGPLVVLDWKSGRVQRRYKAQLEAYAYEARQAFGMPPSGRIIGVVVWLQHAEYEVFEFSNDDLDVFRADYVAAVGDVGKRYAPGEACTFCPRRNECLAMREHVKSAAGMLEAVPGPGPISPASLAKLYPRARMLEQALKSYWELLRQAIEELGPLPIDDGRELELAEQRREEIDARAAWPVLTDFGLNDDDLAQCMAVAKGALEKVVSNKAPRGSKGRHVMQLMERLRAAGAVSTATIKRIQVRKESK